MDIVAIVSIVAVIFIAVIVWRQYGNERPKPAAKPQTSLLHHGAEKHLMADGVKPDSVLSCIYDGGSDGYFRVILGSYGTGRFLRILMENDGESRKIRNDYWRHWDVPWSQLVQVICRYRTTPQAYSLNKQPDGTYHLPGAYYQTRMYSIRRGSIILRLLAPDPRNDDAPYHWLTTHILDSGVRFAEDTQDDPLYGDLDDALQMYALSIETRTEREQHEAAARKALVLTAAQRAALKAECPEHIRNYLDSEEYKRDVNKYIDSVKDGEGGALASTYTGYARNILDLTLVGAIPQAYYGLCFYENFPSVVGYERRINDNVKATLVRGIYAVLNFWLRQWAAQH